MRFFTLFACIIAAAFASPAYVPYKIHNQPIHTYQGPLAPLSQDGRVVDTPEVAHAKAAHLAAHAAEAAKATHPGYFPDHADHYVHENYVVPSMVGAYRGPPAPLSRDGQVIDTPEVAHAKAAHFAAHAQEISKLAQLSYNKPYSHPAW